MHCSVPASEMRATCGFVVRIHAGRHASDEIKAALREMKLNKKYDGKFIRLDEETIGTVCFSCGLFVLTYPFLCFSDP